MAIELKTKNGVIEGKFNFSALYKANENHSTVDENGNNSGDGATNLLVALVEKNPMILPVAVKIVAGKSLDDDEANEIVELTAGESIEGIEKFMEDMLAELKMSGFFVTNIRSVTKSLKNAAEKTKKMELTDKETIQVKAMADLIKLLEKHTS